VKVAVWHSDNTLVLINVLARRRVRLVLATQINSAWPFDRPWVGAMSTSQSWE